MRNTPGIAGRVFHSLGKNGINITAIAQGSSELNISMVINRKDELKALNSLHLNFFEFKNIPVNLFLAGTGNVGSELLHQIKAQSDFLSKHLKVSLRIAGLANSRKMLFSEKGLNLSDPLRTLGDTGRCYEPAEFLEKMRSLNLPNSVYVDCTASDEIPRNYLSVLKSGISVVTPNKRANSGSFKYYSGLKVQAEKAAVKYLYETNVGAGLPIISTIRNLIISGDEIIKIEGILSGTLSYIFNNLSPLDTFSGIVNYAKSLGYTEPDPREDLSGLDVARKLLILIRETGIRFEMRGIRINRLLPKKLMESQSTDEFMDKLKEVDTYFEKMRKKAEDSGTILKFIARYESGKASIGLEPVSSVHPFYRLEGTTNAVALTTRRYRSSPLIISGPGAGADVTAAGVLGDILKTVNL